MSIYHVKIRYPDGAEFDHLIEADTAEDAVTQARLKYARRKGDEVEVREVRPFTIPPPPIKKPPPPEGDEG